MICYYDKNNLDSVCAAAIVRHFNKDCELCDVAEFSWKDIPYVGNKSMGEGWHDIKRRTVYMVGCSLAPEEMRKLAEVCDLILVLSKNIRLSEEFGKKAQVVASIPDKGVSELTWGFFEPNKCYDEPTDHYAMCCTCHVPKAVQLIGAYATGRGDERAKAFSIGAEACDLTNLNHAFTWRMLLEDRHAGKIIDDMAGTGLRVLNYLHHQSATVAEQGAFEKLLHNVDGVWKWLEECRGFYYAALPRGAKIISTCRCVCLNTTNHTKEAFDSLSGYDLMIAFSMNSNQKWKLSFFGDKAEEVAKVLGNEVEVLPWQA